MLGKLLARRMHGGRRSRQDQRLALLGGRPYLMLPIGLAVLALAVQLLVMQSSLPNDLERPLQLRHLLDSRGQLQPQQALLMLSAAQSEGRMLNSRLRGPFWLLIDVPERAAGNALPDVLFLGDRHLQTVTVWPVNRSGALADAIGAQRGRDQHTLLLKPTASGFVLRLDQLPERPARALARVTALGSGTLSATSLDLESFESNERRTERGAVLLAGAFTALALFSTVVAWHSRSKVFALFAPWLMVSAALTSVTLGHDYLLIGAWPNEVIEAAVKQLLLVAYATVNAALFIEVFRRPLARIGWFRRMRRLRSAAASLAVPAVLLPPAAFLWIFYAFALCELAMLSSALVLIMVRTRTPYAGWYALSWVVQVVASLFEVLYAFGVMSKVPGISFESGALVGALMTGVAVGAMLSDERRHRTRVQLRAEESARHYRQVYNTAPGGMLRLNSNGQVLRMNRLARQWFGIDASRDTATAAELFGPDKARELLAATAASGRFSTEIQRRADSSEVRTFSLEASRQGDGIEVVLSDVTDRAEYARVLKSIATRDALTNLLNRRALEQALDAMLDWVKAGRSVCLVHLDLNRFKLVNDLFGHASGDRMLQSVAERLRRVAPAGAVTARLGSDEFAIALPDHEIAAGRASAERFIAGLTGTPLDVGLNRFELSAAVGVVEISADMTAKDVFACADRACMQAKTRGPGTVVSYAAVDGTLERYQSEVRMADALRSGAVLADLELYAQPLVPLRPDRGAALEVLLRVRGDDGRLYAPGRLLGAAERSGAMAMVDRHVLKRVLEHLEAHPAHLQSVEFFTINLSGASLNDARFVADAHAILADHPQIAKYICLEVTESVALYDVHNTRRFIESMREHGTRMALDDFGAGYTSFKYLKDLCAQYIKIDGAFVRDMLTQPAHRAITEAVIDLTHRLGMQAIAEWIEDDPTLHALRQMGSDYGQGFFLSVPRPIDYWLDHAMPDVKAPAPSPSVLAFPARG